MEQKNNSVVREIMGCGRFENPSLVPVMNDLYKTEWSWFNNFFRPSFNLKVKTGIGSRYHRKYDAPVTPYDSVLNSPAVCEGRKEQLREFYATLNPFKLRKSMDLKVQQIKKLSRVTFDDWQLVRRQTPSLHLTF